MRLILDKVDSSSLVSNEYSSGWISVFLPLDFIQCVILEFAYFPWFLRKVGREPTCLSGIQFLGRRFWIKWVGCQAGWVGGLGGLDGRGKLENKMRWGSCFSTELVLVSILMGVSTRDNKETKIISRLRLSLSTSPPSSLLQLRIQRTRYIVSSHISFALLKSSRIFHQRTNAVEYTFPFSVMVSSFLGMKIKFYFWARLSST